MYWRSKVLAYIKGGDLTYDFKVDGGYAVYTYNSAIRNLGLELSTSEYVAFMDSDDLATLNGLTEQVQFLDENKGVVAVSSDFEFFGTVNQYRRMPSGSLNLRLKNR